MNLRALAAALLLLLSASLLTAQTSTGEVNGTVTDPNGGSLPGAVIKLINQATKIETEVKANDSGSFTIVNVKPGNYVLRVEVPKFKGLETAPFAVGVSEAVTQNISLTVGEVSETVQVIADTDLVQRSSTELGTVINERAVGDLPLNGRNFTQLLTLTPGVTPVSTSQNRSIGGV